MQELSPFFRYCKVFKIRKKYFKTLLVFEAPIVEPKVKQFLSCSSLLNFIFSETNPVLLDAGLFEYV